MHKNLIGTVNTVTEISHGYEMTHVYLSDNSYEITRESACELNRQYSDIDYSQYIGTIDSYNRDGHEITITYQRYDNDTFCTPRVSFNSTRIPMGLLKIAQKLDATTPDACVQAFLSKGFTLVKMIKLTTMFKNGKIATNPYYVEDHERTVLYRSKRHAMQTSKRARVTV